jgi:hypothetical protein
VYDRKIFEFICDKWLQKLKPKQVLALKQV